MLRPWISDLDLRALYSAPPEGVNHLRKRFSDSIERRIQATKPQVSLGDSSLMEDWIAVITPCYPGEGRSRLRACPSLSHPRSGTCFSWERGPSTDVSSTLAESAKFQCLLQ